MRKIQVLLVGFAAYTASSLSLLAEDNSVFNDHQRTGDAIDAAKLSIFEQKGLKTYQPKCPRVAQVYTSSEVVSETSWDYR